MKKLTQDDQEKILKIIKEILAEYGTDIDNCDIAMEQSARKLAEEIYYENEISNG